MQSDDETRARLRIAEVQVEALMSVAKTGRLDPRRPSSRADAHRIDDAYVASKLLVAGTATVRGRDLRKAAAALRPQEVNDALVRMVERGAVWSADSGMSIFIADRQQLAGMANFEPAATPKTADEPLGKRAAR